MKPWVRFGLRLVAGVGLLTFVVRRANWDALALVEPSRLAFGVISALVLLLAGQALAAAGRR